MKKRTIAFLLAFILVTSIFSPYVLAVGNSVISEASVQNITNVYTVTFIDTDGKYDSVQATANEGEGVKAPDWTKENYKISWDKDFSSVYSNLTVYSIWTQIPFEALDAPVLLSGVSYADGVHVSWTSVPGADGYMLCRKIGSSGEWEKICDTDSMSYTDSTAVYGTSYYYTVRAFVVENGAMVYSSYDKNGLGVVPNNVVTPPLISTTSTTVGVKVVWGGTAGADGYIVCRKVGANGSWVKLTTTTSLSYTDKTAVYGISYYYTVRAFVVENGTRVYSGYDKNGLVVVPNNVVAPPLISATSTTVGVKVVWGKTAGADGYIVCRKVGANGSWVNLTTTTSLSYTDRTAAYGTLYYYTIRAFVVENGARVYSGYDKNGLEVMQSSVITPLIISTSSTYNKIVISWRRTVGADGYYVYRSATADSNYKLVGKVAGESTLSYSDTNVSINSTYYYKVKSYKGTIFSYASPAMKAIAALSAPVMSNTVNCTDSYIDISWTKNQDAHGYCIYRKTPGGIWTKIATVSGAESNSYKDITANTEYSYCVEAWRKINTINYYSPKSAAITTCVLNTPIINVYQVGSSFSQQISWDQISRATGYQIYYKAGENGSWTKLCNINDSAITSYACDVNHGIYYYYKVRAYFRAGSVTTFGKFSDIKNLITYYNPSYTAIVSDETNMDCSLVLLYLQNTGNANMRIYSNGALLMDHDYDSFNRNLYMIDTYELQNNSRIVNLPYIDIGPGQSAYVCFLVDGSSTWYDKDSTIVYYFDYDNVDYIGFTSSYYGSNYYKN